MIPTELVVVMYIYVFFLGAILGSFANVVICRVPRKESFVRTRSHCDSCGYQLRWFDLVPLFSFIFFKGRCRKCKAKISVQHFLIEVLNGLLYVFVFYMYGFTVETVIFSLLGTTLFALSMIDFKTYEIPVGFQYVIAVLGIIRIAFDYTNWLSYCIGFFAVSVFLLILYYATKGAAIGGGDVKLMAVSGLLLGWQLNILAFFIGCILGSVIHVIRMKVTKEGHVLAMGPYLSAGIMISLFWGQKFLDWYLSSF